MSQPPGPPPAAQPPPSQPLGQLESYLAHFQWRVLQDALAQATADHWDRRATDLEHARPRRGDYHGQATPRDRALKHRQLTDAATACRNKATLLRDTGLDTDAQAAIAAVLAERHTTPEQVA